MAPATFTTPCRAPATAAEIPERIEATPFTAPVAMSETALARPPTALPRIAPTSGPTGVKAPITPPTDMSAVLASPPKRPVTPVTIERMPSITPWARWLTDFTAAFTAPRAPSISGERMFPPYWADPMPFRPPPIPFRVPPIALPTPSSMPRTWDPMASKARPAATPTAAIAVCIWPNIRVAFLVLSATCPTFSPSSLALSTGIFFTVPVS